MQLVFLKKTRRGFYFFAYMKIDDMGSLRVVYIVTTLFFYYDTTYKRQVASMFHVLYKAKLNLTLNKKTLHLNFKKTKVHM